MNAKTEGIIFALTQIAKMENKVAKTCMDDGDIALGVHVMTVARIMIDAAALIERQAQKIKALEIPLSHNRPTETEQ
ncbi:hypothetical protein [Escherichia coli]|uniref:hypothetical protein n=1 Tax=Escherichia coli TaxID=562 RepID=UPI001D0CCE2C|nr:hypothetical protein [Escherichia coli]